MITDYLGRTIKAEVSAGLENLVKQEEFPSNPAKVQQAWDDFHLNYLLQVGSIVGFNRSTQEKPKLTKIERKAFERIFKEYHSQPILQEIFGSYSGFFHAFFVRQYGIEEMVVRLENEVISESEAKKNKAKKPERVLRREYRDIFPEMKKQYEGEASKSVSEKNEDKLNQLREDMCIIEFARSINLPMLMYSCFEQYENIRPREEFKRTAEAMYTNEDGSQVNAQLSIEFGKEIWDNIFNGNEDCISVTLKKTQECINATFQKYWFASLLHTLHPRIHYLLFRTSSSDIPMPLYKVKLMESNDIEDTKKKTDDVKSSEEKQDANGTSTAVDASTQDKTRIPLHLIIGGVLGTNFDRVRIKDGTKEGARAEEFVDSCIREFFIATHTQGDLLLYGLKHVAGEQQPYNQFIRYIKNRDGVDETKLITLGIQQDERFTHRLVVPYINVSLISNIDEKGNFKFTGQQYSESYMLNMEKNSIGAFCRLEGAIRAYSRSYENIIPAKPKKRRWWKYALGSLGVLGLGLCVGAGIIYYLHGKQDTQGIHEEKIIEETDAVVGKPLLYQNEERDTISINKTAKDIKEDQPKKDSKFIVTLTPEEILQNETCELSRIAIMLNAIEDDSNLRIRGNIAYAGDTKIDLSRLKEISDIYDDSRVASSHYSPEYKIPIPPIARFQIGSVLTFKDGSSIKFDTSEGLSYGDGLNYETLIELMFVDLLRQQLGINEYTRIEHDCELKLSEDEKKIREIISFRLPGETSEAFAVYKEQIYYLMRDNNGGLEITTISIKDCFVQEKYTNSRFDDVYLRFAWIPKFLDENVIQNSYILERRELESNVIKTMCEVRKEFSQELKQTQLESLCSDDASITVSEPIAIAWGKPIVFNEFDEESRKRAYVYEFMTQIQECQQSNAGEKKKDLAMMRYKASGRVHYHFICGENPPEFLKELEKDQNIGNYPNGIFISTHRIKEVRLTQAGQSAMLDIEQQVDGKQNNIRIHMPFEAAQEFQWYLRNITNTEIKDN